ncbi:MAG: DUF1294 domain-containing protein [Lachnospiraceae bacterium]
MRRITVTQGLVILYFIVITLVGIWIMWEDKRRAQKGEWRIPEKVLFFVAIIGGAAGTTFGMQRFRHKTKHWYFKFGMPLLFILELAFLCIFAGKLQ